MAEGTGEAPPLLSVSGLRKYFPLGQGLFGRGGQAVKAVDGVSFDLRAGETLGIVGESGCGKSTVARTVLRMQEPTSGTATFKGEDIFAMSGRRLRQFRRHMQIVFQDPYASLNPRMKVGHIIMEPWRIHRGVVPRAEHRDRATELLGQVGLNPDAFERYPTEFSGGQRQRVGLARALALNPEVIVCDEPVSALDVSVQAQVINLLKDVQVRYDLSYIFIAHHLSVVRHISDRVAVMYLGKVVESGRTADIFDHPTHPYTQALISSAPDPHQRPTPADRILLEGDVPSPVDPPSGCAFRTRCWKATQVCSEETPALVQRTTVPSLVACHHAE